MAGAFGVIRGSEALAHGNAAAAHALELNDNLAGAHYALATAYAWYDWDWKIAEKEFHCALDLDPNDALGRNWYGDTCLCEDGDEAVDEHERARQLDPFSLIINANLARSLYWARRYDEAIVQARKTLKLDPRFYVALFWLEGSLRHKNLFREAVALRLAISTPERAKSIEHTFKTAAFKGFFARTGI